MPIRSIALALLLGAAWAVAAPPPKKAPVTPQDIDVDAMARAKDVDASKAAASDETGVEDEAVDGGQPAMEPPSAEEAAAPTSPAEDATAIAAPVPEKAPDPAQDIDVDAMARAKDADASKPAAGDETGADGEALESGQPATEPPPAEEATAPVEAPPAQDAAPASQPTTDESAPEAEATDAALGQPAEEATATDDTDKEHAQACEAKAQKLLDAAEKGDYTSATKDFDARMRAGLPPPKLKAAWESLAQFGALQARGQSHFAKNDGYIAVSVPLVFEKANLYAQVACDGKDQVAGFYVKPLEIPAQ